MKSEKLISERLNREIKELKEQVEIFKRDEFPIGDRIVFSNTTLITIQILKWVLLDEEKRTREDFYKTISVISNEVGMDLMTGEFI
jgi:hypothetical protein